MAARPIFFEKIDNDPAIFGLVDDVCAAWDEFWEALSLSGSRRRRSRWDSILDGCLQSYYFALRRLEQSIAEELMATGAHPKIAARIAVRQAREQFEIGRRLRFLGVRRPGRFKNSKGAGQ